MTERFKILYNGVMLGVPKTTIDYALAISHIRNMLEKIEKEIKYDEKYCSESGIVPGRRPDVGQLDRLARFVGGTAPFVGAVGRFRCRRPAAAQKQNSHNHHKQNRTDRSQCVHLFPPGSLFPC